MRLLVNIDVDDLPRATAFYAEALGLEVGRRFGTDAIELLGLEVPLYLLAKPAGSLPYPEASQPRDYRRHWSPVHLDFVLEAPSDDLPAARDRAVAAGAQLERDIEHHAWGAICHLADPFGNGFCLLRFTAAGYTAIETVA